MLGTAWVTLLRKIRPLRSKGVVFFLAAAPLAAGAAGTVWVLFVFFKIELLLATFLFGILVASLQQRMIFSKRNTWYSRSTSDFVTMKMSSSKSSPKLARACPFQSSTRCSSSLTVAALTALRSASLTFSVIRLQAATPSSSSW